MNFKVSEVATTHIKVEYDDGNWTIIPVRVGWKKEDYLRAIGQSAPISPVEVSLNDNPIKLGDEGVVGEGYEKEAEYVEPKYDYKYVRISCYPEGHLQFEALTDSILFGDDTKLDLLKKHIEMVKELVPADEKQEQKWTFDMLEAKQKEVEADSRSFANGDYK